MSNGDNPLLPAPPETIVVNDLLQTDVDPRQRAKLETIGQKDAGWFGNIWAQLWASILDGLGWLMTEIADSLDQVLAFIAKFFVLGQGEKNSHFYDLEAKILEDLTGVPVDAEALKTSSFGSGRIAGMTTFGGDLYNLLAQEFAPKDGTLETPSADAAKTFLGFLMNFAVRQGNIELLTSLLPEGVRIGEGFRAYGELMAKNLGLGRMARRALQPLIQTLVADPLQYQLNAQYHPKRLAKEQAIKAFFRGVITEQQMRKELSEEGFSQDRQNFMVLDSRPALNDREVVHLYLRGVISQDDLKAELGHRGWQDTDVQYVLSVERPQLTGAEVVDLYILSDHTREEALAGLLKIGYDTGDAESLVLLAEIKAGLVHPKHAVRGKTRTFSQLRKEYIDGVIDLIELQTVLAQLGYTDQDILALTQDVLIDAAKTKSTGAKRAIPSLTWAQIKDAYKLGILTLTEVEQHLSHRGYSPEDIATLVKELPAPPAPPTPTTP